MAPACQVAARGVGRVVSVVLASGTHTWAWRVVREAARDTRASGVGQGCWVVVQAGPVHLRIWFDALQLSDIVPVAPLVHNRLPNPRHLGAAERRMPYVMWDVARGVCDVARGAGAWFVA